MKNFTVNERVWTEYQPLNKKDEPLFRQLYLSKILDDTHAEDDNPSYLVKWIRWSDPPEYYDPKMIHKQNQIIILKDENGKLQRKMKEISNKIPHDALRLQKSIKKHNFKKSMRNQKEKHKKQEIYQIPRNPNIKQILNDYITTNKLEGKHKMMIGDVKEAFNILLPIKLLFNYEKKQLDDVLKNHEKENPDFTTYYGIEHLYRLITQLPYHIYFNKGDDGNLKFFEKEIENLLNFLEKTEY